MDSCFVMLKPGVINRRIVGEIIARLEKKGLQLIGLKLMNITEELAKKHYAEHSEKPFFGESTTNPRLRDFPTKTSIPVFISFCSKFSLSGIPC